MRALLALAAIALSSIAALAGTYADIDQTSTVTNIVLWDGVKSYPVQSSHQLVPYAPPAGIGSVWNGSVFSVPPVVSVVPQQVSRRQARLALNVAGLLTQAETAINAAGITMQIWYQDSDTWDRTDPHVAQMGAAIGLTSAQIDALFVQAAGL